MDRAHGVRYINFYPHFVQVHERVGLYQTFSLDFYARLS